MNALWITRAAEYRTTPEALESAKRLIEGKVEREAVLLRRYHAAPFPSILANPRTMKDVLLFEARAARHFWRGFRQLLPEGAGFPGRLPGAADPMNRLLDIGFHHVTGIVKSLLAERNMPPDLGLLHVARASSAAPLAYDLVELFRADIVDAEALRYARLKKKQFALPGEREIARFLALLNKRLERRHYIAELGSCRTYRSYILLQIERFQHAIDHGEVFEPIRLPSRHDTRC